MKLTTFLVLVLLAAVGVDAQTVAGDRVRLTAAPCTIDSVDGTPDKLRLVDCSTVTTGGSSNLTLNPAGDLVLQPAGADVLPNAGYTVNLGALSNKYLALHASELWVETLVAQNTLATIGGRVLVAPTTTLTADLSIGATSITVKHNNLANGDRVYLEANGAVEFMAITSAASGSGPYTYTVTRNLDGTGANAWYAGDAVLNTGTTGAGFIDLYSASGVLSGSGPTIVGNVRTGTTYNQVAARWAIGNLNGLYGYGATTYGAAFGDPSATNVTVDATNGFRIRSGTTNKFQADTSGNLSIVGDLSVGTSGVIRSGATSYAAGTGWILEYNGGTPRLRIGTAAGNRLTWDGTTLAVVGDGSGLTSINGGNIQTGTITATQIAASTITGSKIAAGTITATNLSVANLSSINSNLGTITGGSININSGTFVVLSNGATSISVLDTGAINNSGNIATNSITMTGSFGSAIDLGSHDINSVGTIYVGGVNATVLRMSAGAGYACVDAGGQLYSNPGGC
jgi:hypothetical protein